MMNRKGINLTIALVLCLVFSMSALAAPADDIAAVRAVDFSAQGGGDVQYPSGRAYPTLSHWDYTGHWLEWEIDISADGLYIPAMMYGTGGDMVPRQMDIDGTPAMEMVVFTTGDFKAYDIGYYDPIELAAGKHTVRITVSAPDGVHAGINPAWLAFLPLEVLFELDDPDVIKTVDQMLGF